MRLNSQNYRKEEKKHIPRSRYIFSKFGWDMGLVRFNFFVAHLWNFQKMGWLCQQSEQRKLLEICIRLLQQQPNATCSMPETKYDDRSHFYSNYFVICWRQRCCCCCWFQFSNNEFDRFDRKHKPEMICLKKTNSFRIPFFHLSTQCHITHANQIHLCTVHRIPTYQMKSIHRLPIDKLRLKRIITTQFDLYFPICCTLSNRTKCVIADLLLVLSALKSFFYTVFVPMRNYICFNSICHEADRIQSGCENGYADA